MDSWYLNFFIKGMLLVLLFRMKSLEVRSWFLEDILALWRRVGKYIASVFDLCVKFPMCIWRPNWVK